MSSISINQFIILSTYYLQAKSQRKNLTNKSQNLNPKMLVKNRKKYVMTRKDIYLTQTLMSFFKTLGQLKEFFGNIENLENALKEDIVAFQMSKQIYKMRWRGHDKFKEFLNKK